MGKTPWQPGWLNDEVKGGPRGGGGGEVGVEDLCNLFSVLS